MVAYEEHAAVNSMLLICNQKWTPQVSNLLNRNAPWGGKNYRATLGAK